MRAIVAALVALLWAGAAQRSASQVFFSRRVYQPRGETYQQICKIDLATGRITQLSHTPHDHVMLSCSPGKQRDVPTRPDKLISPNKSKIAITQDEYVLIQEARTGKEFWKIALDRRHFGAAQGNIASPIAWTPDSKKLLLGAVGAESNSSSPQEDYLVLDITTRKLQRAGTGNNAQWIPGRNAIIYSTPRDLYPLTPGSKHHVWCAQLAIFDLDTGKEKLLTSGITNNVDPIICSQ